MTRALPCICAAALVAATACGGASHQAAPARDRTLRVGGQVEGRRWLDAAAAAASSAGAGPLEVVAADVATEGEKVGAFVQIPEAECVLVLARASDGIGDVDLFSYEDDGSTFATDESPDADAALLVCPPHPRRLYLAARVVSGSGIVALGAQTFASKAAREVGRAVGARGLHDDMAGRLEAWPGLDAKVRAHRLWVGGRWEDVRRTVVPVDFRAATRVSVQLEATRCLDVLVTPSDEIASLELVAEDETGRVVARGREHGRDRAIVLCSGISSAATVAIRSRASQGVAAVVLGRSGAGAENEIGPAVPVDHLAETRALAEARKAQSAKLARLPGPATTVFAGAAKVGNRVSTDVQLPEGCARIDLIAGSPLAGIAADLWNARGVRLASVRGPSGGALFACGSAGTARLDVEALQRPGPFVVELRNERAAPSVLTGSPLAAARLLQRLNAIDPTPAAAAASAQVVRADATRFETVPIAVAPRACVDVIVAAEDASAGMDLRLVDATTGESALTQGREVVSNRLCARETATTARAELRIGAGKTTLLMLARPVP